MGRKLNFFFFKAYYYYNYSFLPLSGLYTLFKEEKIIHRDLKPQNILLNEYDRAFIADVGISKQFEETSLAKRKGNLTSWGGDKNWMAPEMLQFYATERNMQSYLSKLDVFSLGLITLYAIDRDGYTKQNGKLNIDPKVLENYLQDVENKGIVTDKEFFPVLRSMLSFDIDSRISIDKLYHWMVRFLYKNSAI